MTNLSVKAGIIVRMEATTGQRTPSGVMQTAMSFAVQAATSTEPYPTPKLATTLMRPETGMLSAVNLAPKRIKASMSSSSSALIGSQCGRKSIVIPSVELSVF